MHEIIRRANRRMICDICGQHIFKGEKYRAIYTEEQPFVYNEHIQCPRNPASTLINIPKPILPIKQLNHAMSLA